MIHEFGEPGSSSCFATRFMRLMAKQHLANEITPTGCWLLSVVALAGSDDRRDNPALFFDAELWQMLGMPSASAFDSLRRRVVASSWLFYEPSQDTKNLGRYWIRLPENLAGLLNDTEKGV